MKGAVKRLFLGLIRFYQRCISPGLPPIVPLQPHVFPVRARGH